ncbi:MAG: hypothetical protein WDN27_00870 [Candidatus Saccharibacteria bacterium]
MNEDQLHNALNKELAGFFGQLESRLGSRIDMLAVEVREGLDTVNDTLDGIAKRLSMTTTPNGPQPTHNSIGTSRGSSSLRTLQTPSSFLRNRQYNSAHCDAVLNRHPVQLLLTDLAI